MGATYFSKNHVFNAKAKHVGDILYFVREIVLNKELDIQFVCSKD